MSADYHDVLASTHRADNKGRADDLFWYCYSQFTVLSLCAVCAVTSAGVLVGILREYWLPIAVIGAVIAAFTACERLGSDTGIVYRLRYRTTKSQRNRAIKRAKGG